jgi:hypothetical protein
LFALMAKRTQRKDVGAWLGGNRGTVQSRMPSTGASSDTEAKVDAGGGQMEQVRAELGLGAYAAGVGAAGAIGAGVAAVKSGAAARAVNKLTGQQVILHGSPVRNIRTLEPRTSSQFAPNVPIKTLYGMNPETGQTSSLGKFVDDYARQGGRGAKLKVDAPGSIYVAKVPKSSIVNPASVGPNAKVAVVSARSTGKVVKEIPVAGLSEAELQKLVVKAAKRAGARIPKKK